MKIVPFSARVNTEAGKLLAQCHRRASAAIHALPDQLEAEANAGTCS
ncbi:hypothetical protein [Brevibacillus sp. NRS-1366]